MKNLNETTEKPKRHKWERLGHPYMYQKICVKCGCIKDSKVLNHTVYTLNGEDYYNAPPCPENAPLND